MLEKWRSFLSLDQFDLEKQTKRGSRVINLRNLFRDVRILGQGRIRLTFGFRTDYLNPWTAVQAAPPGVRLDQAKLTKLRGFERA